MNAPGFTQLEPTGASGGVKSAARCLDLLELFATNRDGLTLGEVCARTGWPKSSTLGLLRTLHARDFLADGRGDYAYCLGPRVAWLGAAYLGGINLIQEGFDIVRDVSRACDETVHLATLRGSDVHYLAKEEGTSRMRMVSSVGTAIPAHGAGIGKMLLSSLSQAEFDILYPPGESLPRLTANTIVDRDALIAELAAIRERGFALDDGESTIGLNCIAAPVYDALDQMVAAMSVAVPSPRYTPDREPLLHAAILDGARRLSARLGHAAETTRNGASRPTPNPEQNGYAKVEDRR